jgi:8-oxo-dGTP diphosphatase
MKTRFQVAVKALIVNENGDVLLLRRGVGTLDTPGGKIRFGETPDAALRREVLEETGIGDIRVTKLLNAWSLLKDESTQLVGMTFVCEYGGEEIRLSHEHAGYEWVSPSRVVQTEGVDAHLQRSLGAFLDDCSELPG